MWRGAWWKVTVTFPRWKSNLSLNSSYSIYTCPYMPSRYGCERELYKNTACKNISDPAENIIGMSALTYNTFLCESTPTYPHYPVLSYIFWYNECSDVFDSAVDIAWNGSRYALAKSLFNIWEKWVLDRTTTGSQERWERERCAAVRWMVEVSGRGNSAIYWMYFSSICIIAAISVIWSWQQRFNKVFVSGTCLFPCMSQPSHAQFTQCAVI